MDVSEIEPWCVDGNGGAIGRTLLLPLSSPRAWTPGELPEELRGHHPLPGHPLRAARRVRRLLGLPIAVGFALLAKRPDEPFAHAFNVRGDRAIDLALAEHETIAYWGYVPSPRQLEVDQISLTAEAPRPSALRQVLAEAGASRVGTSP
jgi:hypothetical protein